MAKRPQCTAIAVAYYAESAYGTQVVDGNIDQKFEPTEPILLGLTQERTDDAALIKGHEFPEDVSKDTVVQQDVQVPFSFPSSL